MSTLKSKFEFKHLKRLKKYVSVIISDYSELLKTYTRKIIKNTSSTHRIHYQKPHTAPEVDD